MKFPAGFRSELRIQVPIDDAIDWRRKVSKRFNIVFAMFLLAMTSACSEQGRGEVETQATSKPVVSVTNYPLKIIQLFI